MLNNPFFTGYTNFDIIRFSHIIHPNRVAIIYFTDNYEEIKSKNTYTALKNCFEGIIENVIRYYKNDQLMVLMCFSNNFKIIIEEKTKKISFYI